MGNPKVNLSKIDVSFKSITKLIGQLALYLVLLLKVMCTFCLRSFQIGSVVTCMVKMVGR